MKRAQSTWLTSALLLCPPFHKRSHPAEQRQTRGFTRAASPLQHTDSVPFCTENSLISPSFRCHSGRGSGTSHTLHLGSSSYLPDTLLQSFFFPQVKKLIDLSDGQRWKDFWNCRRGPSASRTVTWFTLQIPSCLTPFSRKKVRVFLFFCFSTPVQVKKSVSQCRMNEWMWKEDDFLAKHLWID